MLGDVFLYLLLVAGGLALVHAWVLVRRRALSWVPFVAFGALLSTAAGLWIVHGTVLAQASLSLATGVTWGVLLALGFFASGAVLATAWAAAVRGAGLLAGRIWGRGR